jgi:hypothetical protein
VASAYEFKSMDEMQKVFLSRCLQGHFSSFFHPRATINAFSFAFSST